MPVIIRIDGKNFHSFIKGFKKPFNDILVKVIQKFSTTCFSSQKEFTRSDYVIICGDFELVWAEDSKHDKYWLKWLDEMPTEKEMEYGRQSLEKNNWKVDVVLTHSLP